MDNDGKNSGKRKAQNQDVILDNLIGISGVAFALSLSALYIGRKISSSRSVSDDEDAPKPEVSENHSPIVKEHFPIVKDHIPFVKETESSTNHVTTEADKVIDEQFESFMSNSPAAAWIKDTNGRYTYVNEEFCKTFSLTKDSVIGKTDNDIKNHHIVDFMTHDDLYLIESGKKKAIFEEIPMVNGAVHHWLVHKFPINSSSGKTFSAGIGFDVTNKKMENDALAENERRFRMVAENAKDLVCLHNKDGKYLYVSPSASNLLGYHPNELAGKHPAEFFDESDKKKHALKDFFKTALSQETTDYHFRKKNGEFISLEMTANPIMNESGDVVQIQTISRDVSLRKAFEMELAKNVENLREANKELAEAKTAAEKSATNKEEILASSSHEIRTPINAIIGLTRLMLESPPLTNEQKKYLEAIAKSGDTLLAVLNDILDLSKIEAGKMTFEKISFSVSDSIRYTVDLLRPKAIEKGIKLNYNIDDDVPDSIIGDPVRLNQILINLLSNAIKFTHHGGVKLNVSSYSNTFDNIGLSFSIADTGIGIAPDKLETIFESYTQANDSTTRKYGGTGLGLSIVKRLLELQEGTVEVKSELNVGSSFTFRLLFKKEEQYKPITNQAKQNFANKLFEKRALLVDDNAINQIVANKELKDLGMEVDIANNGLEAINLLQKKDYDIVFMDLMMPEMDGFETTEFIRNKMPHNKSNIPIIAMSATDLSSEMDKSFEVGMNDYILKPFDTANLFNKIAKLISKNTTMSGNGIELNHMEKTTDLSYIKELAEGSNTFIEEIIVMFIDVIPKSLVELEESLERKDWETMKFYAHKIKPSFGFVGAKTAEEIMMRIEKNAAEMPDKTLLAELLSNVKEISSKCLVELKDELALLVQK